MLLAKYDENLIGASPNLRAFCPHCQADVISKCGDIRTWHWAHKNQECKYVTEQETEWHLLWKKRALGWGSDVEKRFDCFIADIYIPDNKIIEAQHSPISTEELLLRSEYYSQKGYQVNWVFDYEEKAENNHLRFKNTGNGISKFKQKWARKSIHVLFDVDGHPIFGHVYIDDGYGVFDVKKIYENGNGWGKLTNYHKIFGVEYFKNKLVGGSVIFNKPWKNVGERGEIFDF